MPSFPTDTQIHALWTYLCGTILVAAYVAWCRWRPIHPVDLFEGKEPRPDPRQAVLFTLLWPLAAVLLGYLVLAVIVVFGGLYLLHVFVAFSLRGFPFADLLWGAVEVVRDEIAGHVRSVRLVRAMLMI